MHVDEQKVIKILSFDPECVRPLVLREIHTHDRKFFWADYGRPFFVFEDMIQEHVLAVRISNTPKGDLLLNEFIQGERV